MEKKKIIIIGSAYPLRGGLASFNERLAREFISQGHEVVIYTFSLQYPNFLFPGKTQYSTDSPPKDLNIKIKINSINPFNWIKIGNEIKKQKPDWVIIKFWLPFMGPCFGTILKRIKSNRFTKVFSIIDNIIPHEKRIGDKIFAQYFVNTVDGFIVMSKSVGEDMKQFIKKQKVKYIPHPIYDNYGEIIAKEKARTYLKLNAKQKYILFFGFIRDYKGLDILLQAMNHKKIKEENIQLIVAGEYYGNEEKYQKIIEEEKISEQLILHTDFISNEEVKYYFCAADLVVQPYKTATQSGISQLAYHFEKPMLVTNVGGLPEIVNHGEAGYVVDVNKNKISESIIDFYQNNRESSFVEKVKENKKRFSWNSLIQGIEEMS